MLHSVVPSSKHLVSVEVPKSNFKRSCDTSGGVGRTSVAYCAFLLLAEERKRRVMFIWCRLVYSDSCMTFFHRLPK